MPIPLSETITAPILFFLVFFIAFSLLEFLIIALLNRLEKKYWEFMVDVVMSGFAHHGKTIRRVAMVIMAVVMALLVTQTKIVAVVQGATNEIKIFTAVLLGVMFLIYEWMTRGMTRLKVEKEIHRYLYEILSLLAVVFIVLMANERYAEYKAFVNREIVKPTASSIGLALDEAKKQKLLTDFREKNARGECTAVDFRKEKTGGIINFIFVASDVPPGSTAADFVPAGKKCSDGTDTFLLTDQGSWYWLPRNP